MYAIIDDLLFLGCIVAGLLLVYQLGSPGGL